MHQWRTLRSQCLGANLTSIDELKASGVATEALMTPDYIKSVCSKFEPRLKAFGTAFMKDELANSERSHDSRKYPFNFCPLMYKVSVPPNCWYVFWHTW